jgi:hypothetical protein
MTFEEAIRKSIRAFLSGSSLDSLKESYGKDIKYTKEYFDELEKQVVKKGKKEKPSKSDEEKIDE